MKSQFKVKWEEGIVSGVSDRAEPNVENLLELPLEKATLTKFPPGSFVLYTDMSNSPLVALRGVVDLVYIDLSPNISSKNYVYRISLESEMESFLAGEYQLRWAPGSSIWMKPFLSDSGPDWKPAVVVGSYHDVEMVPKYSVQLADAGTGRALVHGVAGDCTRYRRLEADMPTDKCGAFDETGVINQTPKGSSPFESPTSIVDPFPCSSMSRKTPSPTDQSQSVKLSACRSNVGESIPFRAKEDGRSSAPPEELVAIADENANGETDQQAPPSKKSRVVDSYPQVKTRRHNNSQVREVFASKTSLVLGRVAEKGTENSSSSKRLFSASTKQVQMFDSDDKEVCTIQIKIPDLANPIRVRDAIMGDCGQNHHERLLRETGARHIELKGLNPETPNMVVVMTIDSSKMQAARELIEDVIASTVSLDERPRMLYYLSKENGYGASEGLARYQRSPQNKRNGEWTWMAVIETPSSFSKHVAVFLGKHGDGIRSIVAQTGCDYIHVSRNNIKKYVFVCAREAKMANSAASLIADRVQWSVKKGERKRYNERRR